MIKTGNIELDRLQRKLNKERDKSAKLKSDLETIKRTLTLVPYWRVHIESYEKRRAEFERVKGLEARVKEQAMLIAKLSKGEA